MLMAVLRLYPGCAVLAGGPFTGPAGVVWVGRTLDVTAISSSLGVRVLGLIATQRATTLQAVPGAHGAAHKPQPASPATVFKSLPSAATSSVATL